MSIFFILGGLYTFVIGIGKLFARDFPKKTAVGVLLAGLIIFVAGVHILPADTLVVEQEIQQMLQQTATLP